MEGTGNGSGAGAPALAGVSLGASKEDGDTVDEPVDEVDYLEALSAAVAIALGEE